MNVKTMHHYTCQALVIGAGVSGYCAAIQAGRLGCDTILVEKDAVLGGNAGPNLGVGITGAFDIPIRQSLLQDLVGRDDLPNAIALNSLAFNGARLIGPALGGFALAAWGEAAVFLINGLSYLAVDIQGRHRLLPEGRPVVGVAGDRYRVIPVITILIVTNGILVDLRFVQPGFDLTPAFTDLPAQFIRATIVQRNKLEERRHGAAHLLSVAGDA